MLSGLLWNFWSFLILFSIIHIGCWYEFIKLHELITHKKNTIYLYLGIVYISLPIILMMLLGMQWKSAVSVDVTQSNYTYLFPCAIIFSIWINDTMAYIVGSLIGKTPFSSISPKKTWEGTIGGAILCVLVIAILGYSMPVAKIIPVQHWIIIAAICAIFGTAGDLLESKLKRMANVKDSGSIMPGHGGFLDRFDSLLIATPFVWLYVQLFV
jgi:phosphatidate cytidylyltransferase